MNEIEKLAKQFVSDLSDELTVDQFQECIQKNRQYKGTGRCASHEYVDANMTMVWAFEKVFDREFDFDQTDVVILGKAWNHAIENDFFQDSNQFTNAVTKLKDIYS